METARREELIKIAASLFVQKGFNGTSLQDIAETAGIQKASLFSHFHSKEEIYRIIVERYLINAQTPKQKFGNYEELSLLKFIELYLESIGRAMYMLKAIIKAGDKTSLRYFSFILESIEKYDDYAQQALKFCNDEIEMWRVVVQNAIDTGEVREDINAFHVAQIFRFSYLGMSYTYTGKGGIELNEARDLLYGIYETIKQT